MFPERRSTQASLVTAYQCFLDGGHSSRGTPATKVVGLKSEEKGSQSYIYLGPTAIVI